MIPSCQHRCDYQYAKVYYGDAENDPKERGSNGDGACDLEECCDDPQDCADKDRSKETFAFAVAVTK